MDKTESVTEYYKNKNIFITGGFGFLGKVLIEKILRSLSDVNKLYVLIRAKWKKSVKERMDKMCNGMLFEQIRTTRPELIEKVILVEGDISKDKLGLTDLKYQELIQSVNIILHLAASIKFDDPLEFAIRVNILGTKNVIDLATKINHLESFVYVSTAYAHFQEIELKEIYYKPKIKWDNMVSIMRKTDEATFEILARKIIDDHPNTYVFTKGLAEDLIWDYRKVLPISIVRPSIVISCYTEPIPGFTDNLYGPNGFMVGACKGVIRAIYSDKDAIAGYIPADTTIKTILSAAWYRHKYRDIDEEKHIYNLVTIQRANIFEIVDKCMKHLKIYPLRYPVWKVKIYLTKSYFMFILMFYFSHLIPSFFIDAFLVAIRQKPIVWKVQKKYYKAMNLLSHFILRDWSFKIDNTIRLDQAVPEEDKKHLAPNLHEIDEQQYIRSGFVYGRTHVLKDKPGEKHQFWFRNKVLEILDDIVTLTGYLIAGWVGFSLVSRFQFIPSQFIS